MFMQVNKALRAGYSIFCATCAKFWRAADNSSAQLPQQCQAVDGCSGPLGGGSFHEYEGPLTTTDRWCFACGAVATHLISTLTGKKFGICPKHLHLAKDTAPESKPRQRLLIYTPSEITTNDAPDPYRKKTVGEVISEVETYYRNKEGREE